MAITKIIYKAPHDGCDHWEIMDQEGNTLACPHTPPTKEFIQLLTEATSEIPAQDTQEESLGDEKNLDGLHSEEDGPSYPTPASIKTKPLTYQPPQLHPADDASLVFYDGAADWFEAQGIPLSLAEEVFYEPDFIGRDWYDNTIYIKENAVEGKHLGVCIRYGTRNYVNAGSLMSHRELNNLKKAQFVDPSKDLQTAKGNGTPRLATPQNVEDMIARMKSKGLEVQQRKGGHYVAFIPGQPRGAGVTFSATPSDPRWAANCVSAVRNILEVDLRAE